MRGWQQRAEAAFPFFKWTVYALLSLNVLLFLLSATVVEALDSLAWVILLLLFEWETRQLQRGGPGQRTRWLQHAGRLLAYVVIVASAVEYSSAGYRSEIGELDMWNAWTWILVVLALEADVWFPHHYGHVAWLARNGLKALLYAALVVYAILWGIDGSWLDWYDASLWILCFFVIELNLFRFEAALSTEAPPT